ncbi:MAG: glycosyltransferase [Proteobacteria bacterium]|nr:glycosyltransferase [Desulfobacula sp.]MBU4132004.1 glycosyltransferase [Pseudomonadota bacterium]
MQKVSIVIPTFNQIKYLPACVDHCLFQTYENLELIIVDGGSTDGTKKYLALLEEQIVNSTVTPVDRMDEFGYIIREKKILYPQNRELIILTFDNDIGATRTYNEGFKRASGDYCSYIVGDDIPHPHMIEELVQTIESTGADFVYSDMNLMDDDGRIIRQMKLPDYDFRTCFAKWFHLGVSKLYRTKLHEISGLMDEENYKSANDYDHYLRFAMDGAVFKHLSRVLYSIRYHGDNRKIGQHTTANYKNLLEESKKCAFRAREWLSASKLKQLN